jgi:hypothetical protein
VITRVLWAVGMTVKVRECPGLGVGTIVELDPEVAEGRVREARVDFGPNFPDGRHVETIDTRDLVALASAIDEADDAPAHDAPTPEAISVQLLASLLPLNAFAIGVGEVAGSPRYVVRALGVPAFQRSRDEALNLVAWLSVLAEIDDATLLAARRLVEST